MQNKQNGWVSDKYNMADVVDQKTRSRMMSGIRGKNTKPEIVIRRGLHQQGFRFRIHDKELHGKPDIVLKRYNAVIFVHGCFWHKHQCHFFKWPRTRVDFWTHKLNANHMNDIKSIQMLEKDGWRICVVWECALKGAGKDIPATIRSIADWLQGNNKRMEIVG